MEILGRRERISLPTFGVENIVAKIDTGAYTSSIHCFKAFEIENANGKVLKFYIFDPSHEEFKQKEFSTSKYRVKNVKSSNGESQARYVIKTEIEIGEKCFTTEFTLSNRAEMRYPVLIGRKFIKRKFLVDVAHINLQSK